MSLTGLKSTDQQGRIPAGDSGGESIPLPCLAWEAPRVP